MDRHTSLPFVRDDDGGVDQSVNNKRRLKKHQLNRFLDHPVKPGDDDEEGFGSR